MRLLAPALAAWLSAAAVAAQPSIEDLIRENTYELEVRDGRLAGPAMDFLATATADAQFVGLAETHNVLETPQITTMLFRELHERHGFNYLALEQGPLIVELLEGVARAGGAEAFFDIARRYPRGLHFRTDQELQMIADVARIPGHAPRVVGLDRATDAEHILAELAKTEPGTREAQAISGAGDELAALLIEGEPGAAEFREALAIVEKLSVAVDAPSDSRAEGLLRLLQASVRNRVLYEEASKTNDSGYRHNLEREEFMKAQLMARYRAAEAAGDREPRFVLKFGQWHMLRGRLWGNYFTLGTLVSELATSNGLAAFIINIQPINRPGHFWSLTEYPEWEAISSAGDPDRWVLVDVRPLRGFLHNGAIEDPAEDFELNVFGADAFLLVGGASRGTEGWMQGSDASGPS